MSKFLLSLKIWLDDLPGWIFTAALMTLIVYAVLYWLGFAPWLWPQATPGDSPVDWSPGTF